MTIGTCCLGGLDVFCDWIIPEGKIQSHMGTAYANFPILSRVVAAPIALFSGVLKVFLFPLICLVGIIAMPIIAVARACWDKQDGGDWLKAWVFCILGLTFSIGFVTAVVYALPLVASIAILVALIGFSVIVHTYLLVKEPEGSPPPKALHLEGGLRA